VYRSVSDLVKEFQFGLEIEYWAWEFCCTRYLIELGQRSVFDETCKEFLWASRFPVALPAWSWRISM